MNDDAERLERPLFQGMDELEREIAPQQLPQDDTDRRLAEVDDRHTDPPGYEALESPDAAPVANIGSSPSSVMAPPNLGHMSQAGIGMPINAPVAGDDPDLDDDHDETVRDR